MENKIQFDLEKYNSGEYNVVTREGLPVKIAGVNEEAAEFKRVVGWICGVIFSWSLNGIYSKSGESKYDLFLIPKKKIIKGWANVYIIGDKYRFSIVRETKEETIMNEGPDSIGVVYIETELIPTK